MGRLLLVAIAAYIAGRRQGTDDTIRAYTRALRKGDI
jgi:hypothetical protein